MTFSERLAAVEERIATACRRANRDRAEVRLMAVSKTHPAAMICEAVAAGMTLFGENRVQEFEAKRAELPEGIEVHMIGHLQSNKAAKAAAVFSAIDTVDSVKLMDRLEDGARREGKQLPVLLEIKLSEEEAKTGLAPASAELQATLERAAELQHVAVCGLMTVAPLDENPEAARTCFHELRRLRESLAQRYPRVDFSELSMGMSGDYEIAIEEGSTLVRIGAALFGAREKRA
ncbi:MAG TPA: YggS family pyridoxal phosphate-dependent enzyme [Acidobacteriaceae bacterium]|nr:YggS family pyridoxal phosphate-dependent enzyme [Acidobacteriaceae bacterium]